MARGAGVRVPSRAAVVSALAVRPVSCLLNLVAAVVAMDVAQRSTLAQGAWPRVDLGLVLAVTDDRHLEVLRPVAA